MIYRAYGGAAELFKARDPRILLEGPANTGKTRAVLQLIDTLCLTAHGIRVLLARETLRSLRESVLVTLETKVWWPSHPIWSSCGKAHRGQRMVYEYPVRGDNYPSTIVLGGLADVGWTYSMEYDVIAGFEAWEFSVDSIERLYRANRNHVLCRYWSRNADLAASVNYDWTSLDWMARHECDQRIILDTNPADEYHPLNALAAPIGSGDLASIEKAEEPSSRVFRSPQHKFIRILSRHVDNPACTEADLEKLRATTGATRARLYLGLWVSQEGQIWDEFDPTIHCISAEIERVGVRSTEKVDRRPLFLVIRGGEKPRRVEIKWTFATQDFGYVSPGCVMVWGVDSEKNLYMLAEIYRTEQRDDWWADRIEEFFCEFDLRRLVCDSEDKERIEKLNDRLSRVGKRRAERIAEGVDKSARERAGDYVIATIHIVKDRLAARTLFFLRDSLRAGRDEVLADEHKPLCGVQEIPGYVYRQLADGRILEEPSDTCPDHGCDAIRYACQFAWDIDLSRVTKRPPIVKGSFGELLDHQIAYDQIEERERERQIEPDD